MGKMLSEIEVQQYHCNGYFFPLDVMSENEARVCRAELEKFEWRQGTPLAGSHRQKTHLLFPWINELMRRPRILDAVEDIIGPDILCWNTHFFIKEPNTEDYVSWHQDAAYWGLSSTDVLSVWVALAPSTVESGCVRFVPGSHKVLHQHVDTFAKRNLLARGQEILVDVNEEDAVNIILEPGQASIHNVQLVHGSLPNRSDDRRIGVTFRYIRTEVKQQSDFKDTASLVRGEDSFGNFELEPVPAHDFDTEMVRYHSEVAERVKTHVLSGVDENIAKSAKERI